MPDDPEELLAQALRAKAGQEAALSVQATAPVAAEETERIAEPEQLSARWILVLAVLLGLATGSVIGLLTLL